jgi:hypothetical protein
LLGLKAMRIQDVIGIRHVGIIATIADQILSALVMRLDTKKLLTEIFT